MRRNIFANKSRQLFRRKHAARKQRDPQYYDRIQGVGTQAFHTALSVKLEDDEVMAIAKEAGWKTAVRPNGPFSVVEVWIENRLLLEVLSPTQAKNYLRAMT